MPGAGKTTMLLEITRSLVIEARTDEDRPVPVLVDLIGWSRSKAGGFTDWLLSEIDRQYGIPPKGSRVWLSDGRLALLFDGLDEVEEAGRDTRVAELNQLQDRYLVPQIAVTSREHDYAALTGQLHLHGAVIIRPLKQAQVLDYLTASQLPGVHAAFVADPGLWTLANSPPMLNLMVLAFHGQKVPESVCSGRS